MTDRPATPTCPDCGSSLPAESPADLCPSCLLRQALASRTMDGAHPGAEASPPPSPEDIADKFPQFEVTECLGRGGMGVVYKARQKSLDRWVAIKILAPERVGEAKFAERFAREAHTLARLSHPNIVTVFDYGETEGLYYIVMEFIDGVNLRDLMLDGKLAPKEALAVVPPICEALQFAHDKGIVHRDIKPENLLLDRDGRIKIADFGIAALVGASGESAGTPPYMAPEQAGGAQEVDHRADIYALGVVLYEMLTGERPGANLIPPSERAQTGVQIDEMVERAMAKDPGRRYQTAGEFRTVVESVVASAPPPPPALPNKSMDATNQASAVPPPEPARRKGCLHWLWIVPVMYVVMLVVMAILGIAVALLAHYQAPKKFEVQSVIMVHPHHKPGVQVPESSFAANELEAITAREALAEVSKQLDLAIRLNLPEEEVMRILKTIHVDHSWGTNLFTIRVRHTDPSTAADIANTLAQVHSKRRAALAEQADGIPRAPVTIHELARPGNRPVTVRATWLSIVGLVIIVPLSMLLALIVWLVLKKLFPRK